MTPLEFYTGPSENLLPSSRPTPLAHGGTENILSNGDLAWSAMPHSGGSFEALTVENQWWMAHEHDCNIGYNSESLKDMDTGVEAWDVDSLLLSLQPP